MYVGNKTVEQLKFEALMEYKLRLIDIYVADKIEKLIPHHKTDSNQQKPT